MFQVNRSENRITKLEEKRFSDLNLREVSATVLCFLGRFCRVHP
jgi:hypothetical protein